MYAKCLATAAAAMLLSGTAASAQTPYAAEQRDDAARDAAYIGRPQVRAETVRHERRTVPPQAAARVGAVSAWHMARRTVRVDPAPHALAEAPRPERRRVTTPQGAGRIGAPANLHMTR